MYYAPDYDSIFHTILSTFIESSLKEKQNRYQCIGRLVPLLRVFWHLYTDIEIQLFHQTGIPFLFKKKKERKGETYCKSQKYRRASFLLFYIFTRNQTCLKNLISLRVNYKANGTIRETIQPVIQLWINARNFWKFAATLSRKVYEFYPLRNV